MKNLLSIILFFSLCYVSVQAQDEAANTYLPQGGEKNLEVKFAPLGENPIWISGIKYRKFFSPTKAYRINLNPRFNGDFQSGKEIDLKASNTSIYLDMSAGIEHHIPATNRLSVYFGYEAGVGFYYAKSASFFKADNETFQTETTSGDFDIGVKGFGGIDYYITRNIYIGTEIGYRIRFIKRLDAKTTSNVPGVTNTTIKGSNNFDLRPVYTMFPRV